MEMGQSCKAIVNGTMLIGELTMVIKYEGFTLWIVLPLQRQIIHSKCDSRDLPDIRTVNTSCK